MTPITIPQDVRDLQSVNDRLHVLDSQKTGLLLKQQEITAEIADAETELRNLGPQLLNGGASKAEQEVPRLEARIRTAKLKLDALVSALAELDSKAAPLRRDAERLAVAIQNRKRLEELTEQREVLATMDKRIARDQLSLTSLREQRQTIAQRVFDIEREVHTNQQVEWELQRRSRAATAPPIRDWMQVPMSERPRQQR